MKSKCYGTAGIHGMQFKSSFLLDYIIMKLSHIQTLYALLNLQHLLKEHIPCTFNHVRVHTLLLGFYCTL